MERSLRQLVGAAAVVAAGLHLLSDLWEWAGGGFTTGQLWVNYLAFALMPFMMVGLYAVQRPRAGWSVLWGALLYGASFVYFGFSTLYALTDNIADYAALWQRLGVVYTVHGALMVLGGGLFAVASWRVGVLPRVALLAFFVGVTLNLVFAVVQVPELWQTIGSGVRNVGLIGMGAAVLTGRGAH